MATEQTELQRTAALAIHCPACASSANEKCTTPTRTSWHYVDWVHPERVNKAAGWVE